MMLVASGAFAESEVIPFGTDKNPVVVKVMAEPQAAMADNGGLTRFDIATVTLAAAALVLTGVGVFVAILAIWGYNGLKDAAVKAAIRTARETARKVSKTTAKDVAEAVALRVSKSTLPFESTSDEAEEVIDNLDDENAGNGR